MNRDSQKENLSPSIKGWAAWVYDEISPYFKIIAFTWFLIGIYAYQTEGQPILISSLAIIMALLIILSITIYKNSFVKKIVKTKEGEVLFSTYRRNLHGINFSGMDLSGVDMAGEYMDKCIFNQTLLTDACLDGAVLTHCVFKSSDLSRVSAKKTNLRGSVFDSCNLEDACLPKADLSNSVVIDSKFKGSDLTKANLYKARFIDSTLQDAITDQATRLGAVFSKISNK